MSASERWGKHYHDCPTCQVHENDPGKDVLCFAGALLRTISKLEMEREEDHAGERFLETRTEPCDHSQTITLCDLCLEHLGTGGAT